MTETREGPTLVGFLKSVFGLIVYVSYLFMGRVKKGRRFKFALNILAAWFIVIVLTALAVAGTLSPKADAESVRLAYAMLTVLFPFMGWLFHVHAEGNRLIE